MQSICTLEDDSFVPAEIARLQEGKGLNMPEASVSRALQWLHLTTAIQSPSDRTPSSILVQVTHFSLPCTQVFKENVFYLRRRIFL